ncbi:hypothetical protein B0H15DRAFT_943687 [Mycena belliarum]|uniref:DUF7330 domain-containing protein n=1 Tax=Mycena belliarum TaxID=1033014 RepID=A0AAD6UHD7_9AGAR|nr:hypothetical protein B0H15DRAFT_943687 [Mycena belliae]
MIIDSTTLKNVQGTDATVNLAALPDDPPPPYFDSQLPSGSSPAQASGSQLRTTGVRPTNYLSLNLGDRSIKGSYAIDPRVQIPSALLPPLEEGVRRKNALLRTTHGPIDVDILVVGDAGSKVDILIASSNGPIQARLHAPDSVRPAIHITAESSSGPITIDLPASFRGPVTLRTHSAAIRISDTLASDAIMLNETESTRHCFVGDLSDWTEDWKGDTLSVESRSGPVTLRYDGEVANVSATPGPPPPPVTLTPNAWGAQGLAAAMQNLNVSGPWGWDRPQPHLPPRVPPNASVFIPGMHMHPATLGRGFGCVPRGGGPFGRHPLAPGLAARGFLPGSQYRGSLPLGRGRGHGFP